MVGRGVWGHLPEGKVRGGQVHERHERECWGSEGHRALVEVKSYKLFGDMLPTTVPPETSDAQDGAPVEPIT